MKKRNLLSLEDWDAQEIRHLLRLATTLKAKKGPRMNLLAGKSVGLVFQKPSNRTRVSFEVGIWQLGGNCIYLGPDEIKLGKRESAADVAQTLSRYLDALVARTYTHDDIAALGKNASVPIINGLSDLYHPCQALADIFSIKEKFGTFKDITIAYVSDGNNVCHSLMIAAAKMGMTMRVATPIGYEPCDAVVKKARKYAAENGGQVTLTHSPQNAVRDADVVYTDVWTSMGQEKEAQKRIRAFKKYQINSTLTRLAGKKHIFMHCLPAHRGQEVTDEVIDGNHSIVFDQAENRMHVQKAILVFLMKGSHL